MTYATLLFFSLLILSVDLIGLSSGFTGFVSIGLEGSFIPSNLLSISSIISLSSEILSPPFYTSNFQPSISP